MSKNLLHLEFNYELKEAGEHIPKADGGGVVGREEGEEQEIGEGEEESTSIQQQLFCVGGISCPLRFQFKQISLYLRLRQGIGFHLTV
jgi:hypothetical protein